MEEGSIITNIHVKEFIPSYVIKKDQLLLSIFPKDFSFIAAENLMEIFDFIAAHKIKINLMQNSALSFSICMDNKPHRFKALFDDLSQNYKVKYNKKMELITIRHYNSEAIEKAINRREIILEQKNRTTLQVVVKMKN